MLFFRRSGVEQSADRDAVAITFSRVEKMGRDKKCVCAREEGKTAEGERAQRRWKKRICMSCLEELMLAYIYSTMSQYCVYFNVST